MRKIIMVAFLTLAATGCFAKGGGHHHKHKKPPQEPPAFMEADG